MIRVAAGEPLSFSQDDITLRGHAIECRINAETPEKNFMPSPGTISQMHLPGGNGVRVDTAAYDGFEISPYYDSMIAKIIVQGRNRTEAIAKKDHSSDSGTVTKAPTCGAAGVRTYSCTSCGTVLRTEEIPATGNHSWDGGTVTKEPSCIESGTKTYTCTVCGQQKTEELPALGHSYENGSCTRCGAADPAAGSAGGEG